MAQKQRQLAVVAGLGKTGLSCVRYLIARGYEVVVVDTRAQPPLLSQLEAEYPGIEVTVGEFAAGLFNHADLLVVSPGLSIKGPLITEAIEKGAKIVGDIELFAREVRVPVIAITGANGKSTVTTLVGAMCQEAGLRTEVAGNIGVPVLSLLDKPQPEIYVLELSSFQLETTSILNARAATVLNITPDHMDRYSTLDEYRQAKARIFQGTGKMIINADDALVTSMAIAGREIVRFGLGAPHGANDYGVVMHKADQWLVRGDEYLMRSADVPLPGRHNVANVLASMALASAAGVSDAAMVRAVVNFRGLAHRTELVLEHNNVRWINDSKGTNVGATVAALSGMTSPVILIAGGEGKGADFSILKPVVAERARAVILLGRDAALIAAALDDAAPIVRVRDMAEAVRQAQKLAQPGDIVLLSPACASFDMFKNFEHRGEIYAQTVREMVT